jgi:hypothetical protein
MEVARAESVDWHDGQSKQVLHLFFLSFASDDGMFSRQFEQKWESTCEKKMSHDFCNLIFSDFYSPHDDSRRRNEDSDNVCRSITWLEGW